MRVWLQEAEEEFEAELTDLWMNDPPVLEDEDSVVEEEAGEEGDPRGPEISGGDD